MIRLFAEKRICFSADIDKKMRLKDAFNQLNLSIHIFDQH